MPRDDPAGREERVVVRDSGNLGPNPRHRAVVGEQERGVQPGDDHVLIVARITEDR